MTYENAPATQLLATHCACCSRPLVDAKSVEIGVGPECRKRHGFDLDVSEEARAAANKLVHTIAVEQHGGLVNLAVAKLRDLGFEKLADRITQRVTAVRIEIDGDDYVVRFPYNERAVEQIKRIPYAARYWDKPAKAWHVRATAKRELYEALRRAFPGCSVAGPKGLFTLQAA